MHEGEGSAREICNDSTRYVRRSENPGKKQCRINGHDPSGRCPLGVGLHQGSSLSPYLFAMIMDVLARGIKDMSPWCMLYADDIVLCGTRSEVVEKKLEAVFEPGIEKGETHVSPS